ncbi:MAG: twin-arginine translocation pathway signal [Cyanobium sp.]
MTAFPLSRRRLLRSAALSLPLLLAGCQQQRSQLLASRGDLPALWTARLPRGWVQAIQDTPEAVITALTAASSARPALVQLWDGWAGTLPAEALQPFGAAALLRRLDRRADAVSRLYGPTNAPALAFPWAIDPWVLLLRDRPDLARRREEGWRLLLDPSLRGKLVLPSSPRVAISLVGGDPERLRQLRRAALACDEQNGLNLVLSGDAEAMVLPRRRAVALLRSDPRLAVLLPEQGAPLGWNLLLRPAGAAAAPPPEWLEAALEPPLLPRLLAAGWVPPLPRTVLERAAASLPSSQRALLLPPEAVLQRCWNLPPLERNERHTLQALWDGAAP